MKPRRPTGKPTRRRTTQEEYEAVCEAHAAENVIPMFPAPEPQGEIGDLLVLHFEPEPVDESPLAEVVHLRTYRRKRKKERGNG